MVWHPSKLCWGLFMFWLAAHLVLVVFNGFFSHVIGGRLEAVATGAFDRYVDEYVKLTLRIAAAKDEALSREGETASH